MSDTNHIERAFGDVLRMQSKARSYLHTDPEVTLMFARKAAEAVLKAIFVAKISENVGGMMLEELIKQLTSGKHVPKHVLTHARTIQVHGNFGAHDQEDDNQAITTDYALPCIHSLDYLCDWFRKTHVPSAPAFQDQADSTVIGGALAEVVSPPKSPKPSKPQMEPAVDKAEHKPSESAKPPTTPKLELVLVSNFVGNEITLTAPFLVKKVAEALGISVFKLIGELIAWRIFATADKAIEDDVVIKVAKNHGYSVKPSH